METEPSRGVPQDRWSEGSTVPVTVTGRISLKAPAIEGTEGIITVDGIAAGVIGEMGGQEGEVKFTAVLDYSLLTKGSHEVRLFIRDENGVITSAGLPTG